MVPSNPLVALTAEELMAWVDRTAAGWRLLVAEQPEVLSLPCDVRETNTVAELIQHIVAVQLRYAQRLAGLRESAYDQIPLHLGAGMFATHDQSMGLLRTLVVNPAVNWEETIEFATRSVGVLSARRRVVLVHLLMHSIRHYAQLATLVRQHGIKPGWAMDYLFMGVEADRKQS